MEDWQLLEDYTERGSEQAFRELVNRHLGLVYSGAWRQVHDPAMVEEISQAVFTLLARKAARLPRQTVLAGWLFQTTRFVAARALRAEIRRQRREQEAVAMQSWITPDETWNRMAPELDEALGHLGETERNAVLLRFLEDKNHREVGAALGISEEAAKKRVNRGLDKLRAFFAGRGVTVPTAVLAAALVTHGANAAGAKPAGVIAARAMADAAAAPSALPVLVREVLSAWRLAKGARLGALALAGIGLLTLLLHPLPQRETISRSEDTARAPAGAVLGVEASGRPAKPTVLSAPQANAGAKLRFRALAADTGEGVSQASLVVNWFEKDKWEEREGLATDETGWAEIAYPAQAQALKVGVVSWGWAARYATWRPAQGDPVPAEYLLRLKRLTNTVGGWLRNEQQKPVANAEIKLHSWTGGDSSSRETPRERLGAPQQVLVARSDRTGWWTCSVIPSVNHGGFTLYAYHPDYVPAVIESGHSSQPEVDAKRDSYQRLWAGTLVTIFKRGLTLTGQVLDEAGHGISGAQLVRQPFTSHPWKTETDAEGRFAIPDLAEESFDFVVMAAGFAPEYRRVAVKPGLAPMEVRLKPGALLRLQLKDEAGQPVAGATVGLEQWGEYRHVLKWIAESDFDGAVEWNSAPRDAELEIYARKAGWCYTRNIKLIADGAEHIIPMRRSLVVTGRATDARTRQPIAQVKAFPGYGQGEHQWQRLETRYSTNGIFTVEFTETQLPWRVRVEAEGYENWLSDALPADFAGTLDAVLKPQDVVNGIQGVVLRPNGQLAADAEVALLTLEHNFDLVPGRFEPRNGGCQVERTEEVGRFSFKPDAKAHSVAAVSAEGYVCVRVRESAKAVTLRLQPWGRLEGVVLPEARKKPVASVILDDPLRSRYQGHVSWSYGRFVGSVNEDGRFVLERVPPLKCWLLLTHGPDRPMTHRTPVTITPGTTTQVELGEVGLTVVGKLAGPPGQTVDWKGKTCSVFLMTKEQGKPKPAGLRGTEASFREVDYWLSPVGFNDAWQYAPILLEIASDGSFQAREVLPGPYTLCAYIEGQVHRQEITVPEPKETEAMLVDLGTLNINPNR